MSDNEMPDPKHESKIERIKLRASDGAEIQASVVAAEPSAAHPNRVGVVIVQEIFGVNDHIRWVLQQFSDVGFLAIAPHFFDRINIDTELDYSPEGFATGREIAGQLGFDAPLRDVRQAAHWLTHSAGACHVAVVGYCWGGTTVREQIGHCQRWLLWVADTSVHP
jgi:carboxymethylenebutenolidase